jgi:hypothetical protein
MPYVEFPPKTPKPPTDPTYQRIIPVDPPVSLAVKSITFAVPALTVTGAEGEVMATTGAGVIATVAVADTFWSSNEMAVMVTVAREGIVVGA